MPDSSTVHRYDSGVTFLCTIRDENSNPVNLTGASSVVLYMKKPSGTIASFTLEIVGPPVNGFVRYVSGPNDFNEAGRWRTQVIVQYADNTVRHSSVGALTVEDNIVNTP